MSLTLVTPPAVEPLTLAEVRAHLRIDTTTEELAPDAPLVSLAGAGAGSVDNGAHRYRLTYVTADGETEGGVISDVVTVADKTVNGKVFLVIPLGGAAVTARKLYRTKAGLDAFLLAGVIGDNATTSYTDNLADSALGAGVPTTNTTGDPLLLALIRTAREFVENDTQIALISQRWRVTLDCFPVDRDTITLPMPPVVSVALFTYVNGAGQVTPFNNYTLDADHYPGRVVLSYNASWPAARAQRNAVVIEFVAGYGDTSADVPAPLRTAMKMLIGSWYENREAVNVGNIVTPMPMGVDAMLAGYRRLAPMMA